MRPTTARPPLNPVESCQPLRLVSSATLVLLAFAVRVWGLAGHSLWLDEAQLLVRAQRDLPTALLGRTPLDLAPPLYPLLLHLWTRLGEQDFLVRFPSVVASVLAVAVLTRLRPWPVGLLAALLYAVAPTQIVYAQEATPYALVGLLASAALVGVQTLLIQEPPSHINQSLVHHAAAFTPQSSTSRGFVRRRLGPEGPRLAENTQFGALSILQIGSKNMGMLRRVAWLVGLAALSAYTYYGLAFLWLGLHLWLLIRYSCSCVPIRGFASRFHAARSTYHPLPTIRHVLFAHLLVALACLPLLPVWWRQSQAGLNAWWGQYGSLEGWAGLTLFAQGALTHGLVFALLPFSQPPPWLVLALLALALLGARRVGWVVGGGLIALGLAYVAASLGRYPFEGRYLLFSAPALYAALAAGLTGLFDGHPAKSSAGRKRSEASAPRPCPEQMPRFARHDRRVGSSLIARRFWSGALTMTTAALVAVLVTAWPTFGLSVPWAVHPPREELRPLLTLLEQRRAPTDAVYVTYGAAPAVAHYQRLGLAPANVFLQSEWPAGRTRFQAAQALAAAEGHPRLWLVVAHALPGEEEALAEALTRRGAWLRARVTAPGAALLLWDMGK